MINSAYLIAVKDFKALNWPLLFLGVHWGSLHHIQQDLLAHQSELLSRGKIPSRGVEGVIRQRQVFPHPISRSFLLITAELNGVVTVAISIKLNQILQNYAFEKETIVICSVAPLSDSWPLGVR